MPGVFVQADLHAFRSCGNMGGSGQGEAIGLGEYSAMRVSDPFGYPFTIRPLFESRLYRLPIGSLQGFRYNGGNNRLADIRSYSGDENGFHNFGNQALFTKIENTVVP